MYIIAGGYIPGIFGHIKTVDKIYVHIFHSLEKGEIIYR
jgi:hypothetical protein